MNIREFRNLTLTFGSDPRRWPADRRASAKDLMTQSPELRELLQTWRPLDEALAAEFSSPAEARVSQLITRVLETTGPTAESRRERFSLLRSLMTRASTGHVTSVMAGALAALGLWASLFLLIQETALFAHAEAVEDLLTTLLDYESVDIIGDNG